MLSKQKVKNLIKEKNIESGLPTQQLYVLYAMDQLLYQLSESSFSDYLIVKGGFLLTSVHGLTNRSTGDLDFTVKGYELNEENLIKLFNSLDKSNTNTYFEYKSLNRTRESFNYEGFEIKLIYHHDGIQIPLNVDFTTGEELIPMQHVNKVKSLFSEKEYAISGYSTEQILTDKFYTLLAYGNIDDSNSRMKDYYDIYLLSKTSGIDLKKINSGIELTMNQRDNYINRNEYKNIIQYLKHSKVQNDLWKNYQTKQIYAKDLAFDVVMDQIDFFSDNLVASKEKEIKRENLLKNRELER